MPRVKLFNKDDVLQKAMELFWRKGFHATSMQDLVSHLGINRGSLYDTFGNKQALFEEAFDLYQASTRKALLEFLDQYDSVKEGFYKLFERAIDTIVQDKDSKGCFVVNVITELIPGCQEAVLSLVESNQKTVKKAFQDYLQKGVEHGEIAPEKDLAAIASLLFTMYNGINVVAKVNSNRNELDEMVKMTLSVLD